MLPPWPEGGQPPRPAFFFASSPSPASLRHSTKIGGVQRVPPRTRNGLGAIGLSAVLQGSQRNAPRWSPMPSDRRRELALKLGATRTDPTAHDNLARRQPKPRPFAGWPTSSSRPPLRGGTRPPQSLVPTTNGRVLLRVCPSASRARPARAGPAAQLLITSSTGRPSRFGRPAIAYVARCRIDLEPFRPPRSTPSPTLRQPSLRPGAGSRDQGRHGRPDGAHPSSGRSAPPRSRGAINPQTHHPLRGFSRNGTSRLMIASARFDDFATRTRKEQPHPARTQTSSRGWRANGSPRS